MTHLDDGTIQSFLHGELPETERELVTRHATSCTECGALVEDARREESWIRNRLDLLNEAPPVGSPIAPPAHRPVEGRSVRRAAAVLVAVLVGGVGVAWGLTAGRPFVQRLLGRSTPDDSIVVAPFEAVPAMVTGIAVEPSPRFSVTFDIMPQAGVAHVTIVETDTLAVRSSSPDAAFESRADGIVVRNAGAPGEYELLIPARNPFVEVRLGNRVVFSRERGVVRSVASPDASGRYRIQLSSSTVPGRGR